MRKPLLRASLFYFYRNAMRNSRTLAQLKRVDAACSFCEGLSDEERLRLWRTYKGMVRAIKCVKTMKFDKRFGMCYYEKGNGTVNRICMNCNRYIHKDVSECDRCSHG